MTREGTTPTPRAEDPALLAQLYAMFRDYFDRAEKKRRWSIAGDIPWKDCNPNLDPVVADMVELFCSVELFLPDYLSKQIPQVRGNRGRAWFLANWGYEESKHSMALGDWLLKSRHRTDEQMTDMESRVVTHEWNLPQDNARGMVCYTMIQELATWLHYRNLRKIVDDLGGDPALDKVLQLISVDERAHFDFFKRVVQLYLEFDREGTLEQLRRVINTFQMPSYSMLGNGEQIAARVASLHIFDERIFYFDVYAPCMAALGLTKADLKQRGRAAAALASASTLAEKARSQSPSARPILDAQPLA